MPTGVYKRIKGINRFSSQGFQKGNQIGCQFQKGNKVHLGFKHSEETKEKIRTTIRLGKYNQHWKGGKTKHKGYWWILMPGHPRAWTGNKKYVKQAILVAEKYLNRPSMQPEIVHHIGKKDDDRPEMLYVFPNDNEHMKFHRNPYPLKSNLL